MKKTTSPNNIIIQICQKLHQKNLISAYGGNVSLRMSNKVIITPRGSTLGQLTEDDLVVIDFHGNVLFGANEPSSETLLHLMIYEKRQDVMGVVHTHSPAATAFAYAGKPIKPINPESEGYLNNVPIVPFQPIGSKELANEVGRHINNNDIMLLEKHGLVTMGIDLYRAYNLAELVEDTALMNLYVKLLD